MRTLIKSDFSTKQVGNDKIKMNLTTINDYRNLVAYNDSENINTQPIIKSARIISLMLPN